MSERPHVVVVGGGISGLTAAHQIRRVAGEAVRITILDQASTVGGKLVSGELDGVRVDLGAESVLARRPEAVSLIGTRRAGGRPRAPRHDRRPAVDPWTAAAPAAGAADGHPHRPSRARRLGDPLVVGTRPRSPGLGAPGVVGRRRSCAGPVRRIPAGSRGRGPARGAAPGRGLCGPRRRPVPRCGPAAARGGGSRGAIVAARSATGERCRAVGRPGLRWSSWRPGTTARRGRRGLRGDRADPADRPSDRAGARGLAHRHRGRPGHRAPSRPTRSSSRCPAVLQVGCSRTWRRRRPAVCSTSPTRRWPWSPSSSHGGTFLRFPRGPVSSCLLWTAGWSRPRPSPRRSGTGSGAERPDVLVIRASVGRFGEEGALHLDDADLVAAVLVDELGLALGWGRSVRPVASTVTRWGERSRSTSSGTSSGWPGCAPSLHAYPSLALCGAAYDGVGVPACIASGEAAAAQVLRALETRRQWGHGNRSAGERAGAVGDSA